MNAYTYLGSKITEDGCSAKENDKQLDAHFRARKFS